MNRRGSYMIEILISAAILAIMAVALGSLLAMTHRAVAGTKLEQQASAYAKEKMERMIAQKIVAQGNSTWETAMAPATETETLAGTFTRQTTIAEAHRVAGRLDQTETSATTIDPDVRLVSVRVNWTDNQKSRSMTYAQYVTNW